MFKMENLYATGESVILFNAFVVFSICFYIITFFLIVASLCKIFSKADKLDLFALVPILNLWLWFEICGISGFWSLIPGLNIILFIISLFKIPVRFGKKRIFGLGILLIPYLFLPCLAFNKKAEYVKPEPKIKKKKIKSKNKKEKIEILELDSSNESVEILELEDSNDNIEVLELENSDDNIEVLKLDI